MSDETERQAIINSLEPLFETAERTGLWFYLPYRGLWFSPRELRACHKRGQFVWGVANWQLRNPQERLGELERRVAEVSAALRDFKERMEELK